MQKSSSAVGVLSCIMLTALVHLPVWADEKTNETASKPAQQQEPADIWQEISFGPEKDLQLTDKQIDKILLEIRSSDPAKAAQLEKLKETDPPAFTDAIREEIQKQINAAKQAQPKPEPDPRWKAHLEQRHEDFLVWFKEQYPEEHRGLIQLQKSDPEKFAQQMMDAMQIYGPIQRMEKYNAELAAAMKKNLDLQRRRDTLLLQIRISPKEEQAKLIEELKTVVSERFDVIVQEKQLQFEWLGKRLEHLTEKLQTRAAELDTLQKTKEQSVEARLKELIERTENVNWN